MQKTTKIAVVSECSDKYKECLTLFYNDLFNNDRLQFIYIELNNN